MLGDMYFSVDAEVNWSLLGSTNDDWIQGFVMFICNAVALTYSPISKFIADIEQAHTRVIPWYPVFFQSKVKIRRNDPYLDPMGYYTLLVCVLWYKNTISFPVSESDC